MSHLFRRKLFPPLRLLQKLGRDVSCQERNFAFDKAENVVAVHLEHRALLHVTGPDSESFLQGLITNDIYQLSSGSHSLYAMFLNTKGKVMYDALFYQNAKTDGIYLECDRSVSSELQKHLKMYRLRKKVEIKQADELDVWAAFKPHLVKLDFNHLSSCKADSKEKCVTPCDIVADEQNVENMSLDLNALTSCNVVLFRDPRLSFLGVRVLCSKSENVASLLNLPLDHHISHYQTLRYKLGVGEGVCDLPPGECFPLESNCDYLNGVSFHKGCYIGQELTARVHHTGVVRKRLMPVFLESPLKSNQVSTLQVLDSQDKVVGKMRNICGTTGIALLRISEALNATSLHVDGIRAYTTIPPQWPCQASKDAESKVAA